jgi:hypothetical protein
MLVGSVVVEEVAGKGWREAFGRVVVAEMHGGVLG